MYYFTTRLYLENSDSFDLQYSHEVALLENNDKCNFNWSLWGDTHIGQAKLLDCNQIQHHVVIAVFQ